MPKSKNKTKPLNSSLSSYFPFVPGNERKNATAIATASLENLVAPQEKRVVPRKKFTSINSNTRRVEISVQRESEEIKSKEESSLEITKRTLSPRAIQDNVSSIKKEENEDCDVKLNFQNDDTSLKKDERDQCFKKKINLLTLQDESYDFMSDEEVWTDKTKERWRNMQRVSYSVDDYSLETVSEEFPLTEEQLRVYHLVLNSRDSLFFTGSAGSGKSMLLQKIIAALKKKLGSDSVAVTAPTGVAAINIGGNTLHWFAGIGKGDEKEDALIKKVKRNITAKMRWTRVEALIIDEISMLDGVLFDKLESIARNVRNSTLPFGGIQVIVTGDFFQLPPISDGNNAVKFCFEANSWGKCIKHTIQLTQVFRQKEMELITILNDMRVGKVTPSSSELIKRLECEPDYPDDGILPTELFPRNVEVNNANLAQLAKIKHKSYSFYAKDWQPDRFGQLDKLDKNCLAPKVLTLKKDAQVMLIKNLNKDLVNGSRGVVIGYQSNSTEQQFLNGEDEGLPVTDIEPIVKFDNGHVIVVKEAEWTLNGMGDTILARRHQIPLILAWAISIHKSQGQTLARVKVDLTRVFEKGQAYVALSRAISIKAIQVVGFNDRKVMVHEKVKNFYKSLPGVKNEQDDQGSSPENSDQMLKSKTQEVGCGSSSCSVNNEPPHPTVKREPDESICSVDIKPYLMHKTVKRELDESIYPVNNEPSHTMHSTAKRKLDDESTICSLDISHPKAKRRNLKLNWGDEVGRFSDDK
ncbi:5887_t:CDS:1, partial [Acaulospora colombiana]